MFYYNAGGVMIRAAPSTMKWSEMTLVCCLEWIKQFILHQHSWDALVGIWMQWLWFLSKISIKNEPLMKIAALTSMRMEVGFQQGLSMNVIHFNIVFRYCCKSDFQTLPKMIQKPWYHPMVILKMQYLHGAKYIKNRFALY